MRAKVIEFGKVRTSDEGCQIVTRESILPDNIVVQHVTLSCPENLPQPGTLLSQLPQNAPVTQ